MNRSIETRLDRLLEARQEQDAAAVKSAISEFLGGMAPETLYACRDQATLRPKLEEFLTTQPAKVITTIERWAARKRKR